jgi:hypothetical protein
MTELNVQRARATLDVAVKKLAEIIDGDERDPTRREAEDFENAGLALGRALIESESELEHQPYLSTFHVTRRASSWAWICVRCREGLIVDEKLMGNGFVVFSDAMAEHARRCKGETPASVRDGHRVRDVEQPHGVRGPGTLTCECGWSTAFTSRDDAERLHGEHGWNAFIDAEDRV